jgi:hypothetical protein
MLRRSAGPAEARGGSVCWSSRFEDGMRQLLNRIRDLDRRRRGFPGEHFIVAAAGSSLLKSAGRRRGLGRALALVAGGALLARAASGRDGLGRLKRPRRP